MGTIAEKLAYLNGTKAALRQAINDAGGYLTVDSTFRSYAGEWLREKSATLSLDFWCERFIARRQGSLAPVAIGSGVVNFTRSTTGGRFNEYGLYVSAAIDAWRLDHDPASLTTSSSTVSFDSSVASFELPSGHAFFVGDLFRATAVAGSLWGVVVARSATSVVVHVRNSNATGSASSWTCIKPLGLLIEEQRTNLALWSRDLTNAVWGKTNVTPSLTAIGIDGVTNSATTLTAGANNGTVLQSITSASAARATTAYVKRRTGTGVVEMTQNGGATWVPIAINSTSYTRVGPASATVVNPQIGFRLAISGDQIDIDMVQCESGAFATSAMPTAASQVTRTADIALVNTLSPWYNASEGTLFVEFSQYHSSNSGSGVAGRAAMFSDGTTANAIGLARSGAGVQGIATSGSVSQVALSEQAPLGAANTAIKAALAYKLDDYAMSVNGKAVLTDTSASVPIVNALWIGQRFSGNALVNGHIPSLRYWPKRDMPIQEMTA